MADEGVAQSTLSMAGRHPYWVVGGFVALVAILYLASGSKSSATPAKFNFSYGPSDTQIKAGTDLAIAQANDQTSLSMATLQATTGSANAQTYYNYLATANANATVAAASSNAAAVTMNGQNNRTAVAINGQNAATAQIVSGNQTTTALGTAGYATEVALHGQDTGLAGLYNTNQTNLTAALWQNATNLAVSNNSVTTAGYAMQTTLGVSANTLAGLRDTNASGVLSNQITQANTLAGIQDTNAAKVRISTSQDYTSGVLATINANASMYNTRGSVY